MYIRPISFRIFKMLICSIFIIGFSIITNACTTILVGKNYTLDGVTILAHNEDMGHDAVGRLWHEAGSNISSRSQIIPHNINIPLPQKYGYWASGNSETGTGLGKDTTARSYHNILVGLNQPGVAMACNWMHSKDEAIKGEGVNRYAIRQLILETAGSAREAVMLIGQLIEKHKQADWGGLTYCLADANEAWIVETTATQWVARRIKDDEIHVVANQFTIETDYDLHSANLVEYAQARGWYDGKVPFNFKKVYGKVGFLDTPYDTKRENRIRDKLGLKKGVLTVQDLMVVLRDRYEGTPDFHLPVKEECWRDHCNENQVSRAIATNLAQSSSIAVMRDSAESNSTMMWYCFGPPHYAAYIPIFIAASQIPSEFSESTASENNAWMLSKRIRILADADYYNNRMIIEQYFLPFQLRQFRLVERLQKMPHTTPDMYEKATLTAAEELIQLQKHLYFILQQK